MKIQFIINPVAGRKKAGRRALLIAEGAKAAGHSVDIFYTSARGDGFEKASALLASAADLCIAVGGDGTVNEVVRGLIGSGQNIPLAILAAGTVNDFAVSGNLPQEPKPFLKMLNKFNVSYIDVGVLNGLCFINVAAGGALSEIAYSVPQKSKSVFGKLAYYAAGLKSGLSCFKKSYHLKFTYDSGSLQCDTLLFIVANSKSVGGFRRIAPLASICDGVFDVCVVKKTTLLKALPLMLKILRGKHLNDKRLEFFTASQITVENMGAPAKLSLDIDGEEAGLLPALVECRHNALKLLQP
jgi:diacylglycerol kinase (ATP)